MALLLTVRDLALWAQTEIASTDAFGKLIVEVASEKVCSTAGHPEWTASGSTAAPARARHIAGALAARSYKNPDSVLAEGSLGPLGGDRTVEELARFMHLTAAETAELVALGGGSATSAGGGLWVQPIGVYGSNTLEPADGYVMDNQGDDWAIPYFAAEDIGT